MKGSACKRVSPLACFVEGKKRNFWIPLLPNTITCFSLHRSWLPSRDCCAWWGWGEEQNTHPSGQAWPRYGRRDAAAGTRPAWRGSDPPSLSGTQTPASNASTPPSSEGASSHARLSSASSPPRWSPVLFSLHSIDARNVTDTEKNTRLFNTRCFTVLTLARLQTNPKRTHTHTHTHTRLFTALILGTLQNKHKEKGTGLKETETKSVSGHTQVTPLRGA